MLVTKIVVVHPMSPSQSNEAKMNDNDIVSRVLGGDTDAFEHLVRKYNERLFRIGMGYLKNPEATEDAMQQAYLQAYRNLATFGQRATFATWITRIMINECLMVLRKRASTELAEAVAVAEIADRQVQPATAESMIIAEEMRTTLEKAVLQLPDSYRTVFIMREVEQMSTEETAAYLHISAENVKVRLHRAKEHIRTHLLQMAEGVELFGYHLHRCDVFTARVMEAVRNLSTSL